MADPLTLLVISAAVSLALSAILAPKSDNPIKSQAPTTTVKRGSYERLMFGVRRVGPLGVWFGDRSKKSEGGGKKGPGGGGGEQTIFYEAGVHALGVGPFTRLRRITQQGKVIFEGPIDPVSHPSGTVVDLGKPGSFEIYWGEEDQPVDMFLADPSRLGIASRFPYAARVQWRKKRLGPVATWPLLDYELERRVQPDEDPLTQSASWFEETYTLSGESFNVYEATDGTAGVAKIRVRGRRANEFQIGGRLLLSGNAAADGDYRIQNVTQVREFQVVFPPLFPEWFTDILLAEPLTGADNEGTIEPYVGNEDDGANPAHVLAEVLFAEYPHGLGHSTDFYDLDSLEALGVLMETEKIPISPIAEDGQDGRAFLQSILADLGVMTPMVNGKIRFVPIRKPVGELPALTDHQLEDPLPEIANLIEADEKVDRTIYSFADRTRQFQPMTFHVDNDGQAEYFEMAHAREVEIASAIDLATASKIGNRRSQEDGSGGGTAITLYANREARFLYPGRAFTAAGIPFVLRASGRKRDTESSRVEIQAFRDAYGVDPSAFQVPDGGGGEAEVIGPQPDLLFAVFEVPAYELPDGAMRIFVPRLRDHDRIDQADIWLSANDVTYERVGTETAIQTGGVLLEDVGANGTNEIAQGPTVEIVSPDAAILEDLSGDETNWRLGRQMAIFASGEVAFFRKATLVSGSTYRLDGLIRARFDTEKADQTAGTAVFLVVRDQIAAHRDLLLEPGATVYVKTQPIAGGESVLLSEVEAVEATLRGKGITPMNPGNLYTGIIEGRRNIFIDGQDVEIRWDYQSAAIANTSAGMQNAGAPTAVSPVEGEFRLTIRQAAGDIVRVEILEGTTFTYTAAMFAEDFLFAPSSYRVSVVNFLGGLESDELEITVNLLS